jgi:hypothetical protein
VIENSTIKNAMFKIWLVVTQNVVTKTWHGNQTFMVVELLWQLNFYGGQKMFQSPQGLQQLK